MSGNTNESFKKDTRTGNRHSKEWQRQQNTKAHTISGRLTTDEFIEFQECCTTEGVTKNAVIVGLVRRWMAEKESIHKQW